jgi:YebC/PmpR family DNA-binding regulatory protein
MSGHSKWATIKRKKAATDSKRGKLFAKLIRAVEVAARQGGGDPAGNAALAAAIAKARSNAVPHDNIERAVNRAIGADDGAHYEEVWYEGYGPGGVALYVQILTDNRNRAASDVRSTFTRNGGNLGQPGSVGYLFETKGYLEVNGSEDDVMVAALEAGAEDVQRSGDSFEVTSAPTELAAIQSVLKAAGLEVISAELTHLPKTTIPVDASTAARLLRLIDALEDLEDVQTVYANYEMDDAVMAQLAEG